MKEKQKRHYSVWLRVSDGIYTCKDIEELLADTKTDRSKDFDEASACLWKTGEEESSSSWEEWIGKSYESHKYRKRDEIQNTCPGRLYRK